MKIVKQAVCLALLGAGLTAVPGVQATAAGSNPRAAGDNLVQQMRHQADGSIALTTEAATGRIGFIRTNRDGDLMPSRAGGTLTKAADKATAYLTRYAAAFGARPGELRQRDVMTNKHGWTVVFGQEYQGIPVFGAQLRANLDKDGDLTSVNGYAAPGINLSPTPTFSAEQAAERAIALVRTDSGDHEGAKVDTRGLKAVANELFVYRIGSTRGETGKAVLAHVIEVSNERNIRDMVFIDANTGKAVNRYSMMHSGLHRELYEGSPAPEDLVWEEGDPLPGTLNEDQESLVRSTGDSYWFFANTFGRDSYDDAGHVMRTVNNDPTISCPNANWNGNTTNYCDGVTSDDVVAHEWGHAYTEYTNNLIYQWQSGALNESYSDIWGETVDLINGRLDEGEGDTSVPRGDGECSKFTRGNIGMTINAPAEIAGECPAAPASFGPVFDSTGVTTDLVVGSPVNGCTELTNPGDVAGKFVYIDRGACTFATKARNAADAGATGIVVGNNQPGAQPFSMSGSADIYGLMTTFEKGADIKAATETVNITVRDIDTDPKSDSTRWLMGEKSDAFGGAIRDMWTPTCYGDPGKVTDAEYHCDTSDAGGVHSNSGVPNHGYALLVDGGDYNGVTVDGIGLDKAANIFFRTQIAYLTETSDFTDLADGLAASCTDLIGAEINQVSTSDTGGSTPAAPITADDCTSVDAMADAVELRTEPTQCNFQPLLDPNAPAVCGEGYTSKAVFSEDFEDGLAGWALDEELGYPDARGFDWEATNDAPAGNDTQVAYGSDPDEGNCASDSIASRNSIISPSITFPAGESPRLVFDHNVATEPAWDGANVKVSINGADFVVVPEAAYLFNAPNGVINPAAAGNDNPMAGEVGFTGTDGGTPTGSWGQSQIDLAQLGASVGDSLQFRFDMGRDGCGGRDGWYVDNVEVLVCLAVTRTKGVHKPQPSKYGKKSRVLVRVVRDGSTGDRVSGLVRLHKRGQVLSRARVTNGRARLNVPKRLRPGRHVAWVKYTGTDFFAPSKDKVIIKVVKKKRKR